MQDDHRNINNYYKIDKKNILGKGTIGKVVKANIKDNPNMVFAIKIIEKQKAKKLGLNDI
jgi:hypothetical protein